ncbi:hypothetical protein V6Z12_A12G118200 [Gossypium hirsutum]
MLMSKVMLLVQVTSLLAPAVTGGIVTVEGCGTSSLQ